MIPRNSASGNSNRAGGRYLESSRATAANAEGIPKLEKLYPRRRLPPTRATVPHRSARGASNATNAIPNAARATRRPVVASATIAPPTTNAATARIGQPNNLFRPRRNKGGANAADGLTGSLLVSQQRCLP